MSDEEFVYLVGDVPAAEQPGWSGAQRIALAALVTGANYGEAAGLAGVSSRTITRWMAIPEFRAEVESEREQQVARLSGLLMGAADQAIAVVLQELLGERAQDRLKAAALVFPNALRFRQHSVVEVRLGEIERQVELLGRGDADGSES